MSYYASQDFFPPRQAEVLLRLVNRASIAICLPDLGSMPRDKLAQRKRVIIRKSVQPPSHESKPETDRRLELQEGKCSVGSLNIA